MQDATMTIRVPQQLRDAFLTTAKQQGLTGSLVLRKLMQDYLQKNAQIDIFEAKRGKK